MIIRSNGNIAVIITIIVLLSGSMLTNSFGIINTAKIVDINGTQETEERIKVDNLKLTALENKFDLVRKVAIDSQNNIISVGIIHDSPKIDDSFIRGFISKINPDGQIMNQKIFAYDDDFYLFSIAVDLNDNIFIAGTTSATDLPTDSNSLISNYQGLTDSFLMKLTPDLAILWVTYIGGSDVDSMNNIAVDNEDNLILYGQTNSEDYFDLVLCGHNCGTITKISNRGDLLWTNSIGTSGYIHDLTIDTTNNYVGVGYSGNDNVNIIGNSFQSDNKGSIDGIVFKLSSYGDIIWSTYFGGNADDLITGVKTNKNNQIIFTGHTKSNNFPLSTTPFQNSKGGFSHDSFVTILESNGSLSYSSYLGKSKIDKGNSVEIKNNGNIILTGITLADDFYSVGKPIFESASIFYQNKIPNMVPADLRMSGYIIEFTPSMEIVWSQFYGNVCPNTVCWFPTSVLDQDENLIIGGQISEDSIYSNFPVTSNVYPYHFGDNSGYIIKLNAERTIEFSLVAPIITDPKLDYDEDGLSNQLESELCLTFGRCVDPINADTDGDGMNDGWEHNNELNPLFNDANRDLDEDGLTNIDEFSFMTNPNVGDTDNDTMLDGWEVAMMLNPLIDDSNDDLDNDGMPNLWEFTYNFTANVDDGNLDFDNDGLTNYEEFLAQTSPINADTDGDGMNDGWEKKYGLNPLEDDANGDLDKDYIPNHWENRLNTNPNNRIQLLYLGLILVLLLGVSAGMIYKRYKRNANARSLGFTDHSDYENTITAGFTSQTERALSTVKGYKTKEISEFMDNIGYTTIDNALKNWRKIIQSYNINEFKEYESDLMNQINHAKSPKEFNNIINSFKSNHASLKESMEIISKANNHLEYILGIFQQTELFVGITETDIRDFYVIISQNHSETNKLLTQVNSIISDKIKWFEPWKRLLEFIQVTEENSAIEIDKIAEIIGCTTNQAEAFIQGLLDENTFIGKYDSSNKKYTKGTDIQDYLVSILKDIVAKEEID